MRPTGCGSGRITGGDAALLRASPLAPPVMADPRFSRPVSVLLFLLAVLLIIGVPAMCAIGNAYDADTPTGDDVEVEGIPDVLDG